MNTQTMWLVTILGVPLAAALLLFLRGRAARADDAGAGRGRPG